MAETNSDIYTSNYTGAQIDEVVGWYTNNTNTIAATTTWSTEEKRSMIDNVVDWYNTNNTKINNLIQQDNPIKRMEVTLTLNLDDYQIKTDSEGKVTWNLLSGEQKWTPLSAIQANTEIAFLDEGKIENPTKHPAQIYNYIQYGFASKVVQDWTQNKPLEDLYQIISISVIKSSNTYLYVSPYRNNTKDEQGNTQFVDDLIFYMVQTSSKRDRNDHTLLPDSITLLITYFDTSTSDS